MHQKQVEKEHYHFSKYVKKNRWLSMWHQLDEVLSLAPESVLELGPGPGLFKVVAAHFGVAVKTVDIDPNLEPDYVASATELPIENDAFDCVCAFQMLEHLPYSEAKIGFAEIARVARNYVVISLPDANIKWVYSLHIPKIGVKVIHLPRPQVRSKTHEFNGEHYWEINKRGYPLKKIINDLLFAYTNVELVKTYRVPENPYHRFFIFRKV
jgi:SAM-dependent methyltransferase